MHTDELIAADDHRIRVLNWLPDGSEVKAVVHLFHHGIVRIDGQIEILPLFGAIWIALIFGTGVLFAFLRRASGSLVAPILSHAAFNLAMNFTIFYWLPGPLGQ